MVRQATDTAVSASISTPVWPVDLHRRLHDADPAARASARCRRSTLVRASGWQSGISSCVLLAAMMPAMRAVAEHVALLGACRSSSASVSGAMATKPSARARARGRRPCPRRRPCAPRPCVEVGERGIGHWPPRALRRDSRRAARASRPRRRPAASGFRRRGSACTPARASRCRSAWRGDAALGDDDAVLAARAAPAARSSPSVGLEGLQVAVVDADQAASSASARSSSASSCTSTMRIHAPGLGVGCRACRPSRRRRRP